MLYKVLHIKTLVMYSYLKKTKDLEKRKKKSRMEESNNAQEFSMLEIIEFDWRECIFVIVNKDCGGSRRSVCDGRVLHNCNCTHWLEQLPPAGTEKVEPKCSRCPASELQHNEARPPSRSLSTP